jgi:glycosyltransferase involved in cell wall biosynthesis
MAIVRMMPLLGEYNLILSGNNDKAYGKEIQQFIDENKLHNQVFLTGKVDEMAKQYYLSKCHAFVFPSIREGFGLPPIEAMRFGKPIFLANKTSLPEIGGGNCYYWDHFEEDYMKSVLLKGLAHFYDNQKVMEDLMIQRALTFDWKKAASEYLQVYRTILS